MSAQVYSVPGQTEVRSKDFLEWKSIDLSHEISLTCGGNFMLTIKKVFFNLFLLVRIGNILAIFKLNQEVESSIFKLNEIAIFQSVNENFWKHEVSFP